MDSTGVALATEDIKRLKARYFRSMDTKDEESYRALLTADFTFDAPGIITDPVTGYCPYPDPTTEVLRGRDECATTLFSAIRHPDYNSVHLGHMPDIQLIDADSASGIWSMSDVINFPGPGGKRLTLVGYGHYFDHYRREGGVWKISSVTLTRLRVDYPYEEAWVAKTRRMSIIDGAQPALTPNA